MRAVPLSEHLDTTKSGKRELRSKIRQRVSMYMTDEYDVLKSFLGKTGCGCVKRMLFSLSLTAYTGSRLSQKNL